MFAKILTVFPMNRSLFFVVLIPILATLSGCLSTEAMVFRKEDINRFLSTAPDLECLDVKVIVVLKVAGAMRMVELERMKINEVKVCEEFLIISVPGTSANLHRPRQFTIEKEFAKIVKKYMKLRPREANSITKLFLLDYNNGECTAEPFEGNDRRICEVGLPTVIESTNPEKYTREPKLVSNCSVWNLTATSFSVRCTEYSEANTESDHNLKSNISVRFQFAGLQPDTRYVVNIESRSEPFPLEVTTLARNPEKTLDLKEAEKPESKFQMSTTMTVVVIVVLVLIVVACLVATGLQCYRNRMENLQNKDKFRDETNVYSSNDSMSSREKNRDGYIPLRKILQ